MLFLKMDGDFFSEIMSGSQHTTEKIVAGVMDAEGQFCALWRPKGTELPEKVVKMLRELSEKEGDGMILDGLRIHEGALMVYRQENSGLIAFTFVPDKILASGMMKILLVLAGIYLLVIAIAVNVSIYFSRRFTRPIQDISEAMSSFDGNDFSRTIDLYTNTELDQIGYSYNQMLGKIERLLREIREQEEELRKSELNMLISQINPHFLYNTLDTIYMLARINKEETTMKMIQALSRYLRLSLNKGSDIVTVENELENVKSYMEIQQIRNKNLFHYEIDCQVKASQTWILKLILQPLVENAIKYGFCNIYEGGVIRITVKKEENCLVLTVYNTGKPMDTQTVKNLNSLVGMSVLQMKESFPDRQHGYGIVNIITRLRLKYGEDIQFCYETDERGTKCIIKVPAKDAERI